MHDENPGLARSLLPATRWLLVLFSLLTLLAVNQLLVLTTRTDDYFAWTIDPPLTAAFLGAGYAAGFVLVVLALRSGVWADVRVPVVTILVFTTVTLLATLLHLGRFHFSDPEMIARFAAWFWLTVYLVVPVALLLSLILQRRSPGSDPKGRSPLPAWLGGVLAGQGLLMLAVGVGMFLAPATSEPLWPWPLAPLSARVVAAWLIAFGVAALLALRERDLTRLRISAIAYTLFGVLQVLMVLRFAGQVQWTEPSSVAYLVVLATIIAAGGYGWWAARRAPQRAAVPAGQG